MNNIFMIYLRKNIGFSLICLIILLYNQYILAWTNLDGGDHGGQDWTISISTNIAGVHVNIGEFKIINGVVGTVRSYDGSNYGSIEIHASTFTIGGTLDASGSGNAGAQSAGATMGNNGNGSGAGYGGSQGFNNGGGGAGGGAYGGAGGRGQDGGGGAAGGNGGVTYDVSGLISAPPSDDDTKFGSGGGNGGGTNTGASGGIGGNGGGKILLFGIIANVSGSIISKGSNGSGGNSVGSSGGGGGGGSGGSILIDVSTIICSGNINADGGAGSGQVGNGGGGGGGAGGRIKLFYNYKNITSISVAGGAAGGSAIAGSSGSIHYDQKPTLTYPLSPANGSIAGIKTFLSFKSSVDSDGPDDDDIAGDGTGISYETQVSTNFSFLNIFSSGMTIYPNYNINQNMSDNVTYYWRVRASDQYSNTLWSDVWSFIVSASSGSQQVSSLVKNFNDFDHYGSDWIISSDITISGVHANIGVFRIDPGVTLYVEKSTITSTPWNSGSYGKLEIYASTISIYGAINANSSGLQTHNNTSGYGNGGGNSTSIPSSGCAQGGGGYGAVGGNAGSLNIGGSSYGVNGLITPPPSTDDLDIGSSGGSDCSSSNTSLKGGSGGGAVLLSASSMTINYIVAQGTHGISLISGQDVSLNGTGGGSGGSIVIDAYWLTISSGISVRGGDGGRACCGYTLSGGSGSGGRIKIFCNNKNTFFTDVSPGAVYSLGSPTSGGFGTVHYDLKPDRPNLKSPLFNLTTNYVLFDWDVKIDTDGPDDNDLPGDGTAVTYEIEVSRNSDMSSVILSTNPANSNFTSTTTFQYGLYYWHVRAFDQNSYTIWSDVRSFRNVVSTQTNLSVSSVFVSSYSVLWGASAPENLPQTTYLVQVSTYPNFSSLLSSIQTTRVSSSAIVQGLTSNTTFYSRVIATNFDGYDSTSAIISTVTLASPPSIFSLSLIGSTSFQVVWQATGNPNGTLYNVLLSTSSDFIPVSSTLTINSYALISNLNANSTYYYKIAGRNWSGIDNFSQIVTTVTFSSSPSTASFITVSSNSIEARWGLNNNPSNTLFSSEISTNDFSSGSAVIMSSSSWQMTTNYLFINLSPNTTYYFRAKSKNSNSVESAYTILGGTTTLASIPTLSTVTAAYDETSALGYYVRVFSSTSPNNSDTALAIEEVNASTVSQGYLQGNGTTGLNPVWMKKSEWESFISTNAEGALASDTSYYFRVYARSFTNFVSSPSSVMVVKTPPSKPGAPTITQKNNSYLEVAISSLSGVSNYWVYYATWSAAPVSQFVQIATLTLPTSTYSDSLNGGSPASPNVSLTASTSQLVVSWNVPSVTSSDPRFYRVTAVDSQGRTGQKSNVGTGDSQVVPSVTEYGVYKNSVFFSSTTLTTFTSTGLLPNTSYQYSVAAKSNQGQVGLQGLTSGYTLAETPGKSSFGVLTTTSVQLFISSGSNPAYTEYAIFNIEGNGYIKTDSSLQAGATYYVVGSQVVTHGSLVANTTYTYRVKARNAAQTATVFGTDSNAIVTLANAPVVASISHSTSVWSNQLSSSFTASQSDHYHYILDQYSLTNPTSNQIQWSGTTLNLTLTSEGTYYLHVLGDNSQHANSGMVHFGPIRIDTTPPVGFGIGSIAADTSQQITVVISTPNDLLSGTSGYWFEDLSGNQGGFVSTAFSSSSILRNTGLSPNRSYSYRIRVEDFANNVSSYSPTLSKYTYASVPSFLSSARVSSTGFVIDWSSGGNPVNTYYEINFSTDSNFNPVQVTSTTLLLSVTVQSLAENTTYYIRGRARNEEGVYTDFASLGSKVSAVGAITINSEPQMFVSSAIASWVQGSNPSGTQYYVEASSVNGFGSGISNSGWMASFASTFTALLPNTSYYFRIKSRNFNLEETPSQSFNSRPSLAAIPSTGDLSIALSSTSIQFAWVRNGNPVDTEFLAEISTDSTFGIGVSSTAWIASTYTAISNLQPGKIYWPRVRARNRYSVVTNSILLSTRSTLSLPPVGVSLLTTGAWTNLMVASFSASGSNHFHYIFSTNPYAVPASTDTIWDGTTLGVSMNVDGDWYLAILGDNPEHVNSGVVTLGPIRRDRTPPTLPALSAPSQGSTISVITPDFNWTQSSDSNSIIYSLEVSSFTDFSAFTIQKINLPQNNYTPLFGEALSDSTTYYWRVRPRDSLSNISTYTATNNFYVNLGALSIISRETYDSDGDGVGDALKISFNMPVNDSTFVPSDFVLSINGKAGSGVSILTGVAGDVPNDRVLYLVTSSTYSLDNIPSVRYSGGSLKSISGKILPSETSAITATNKIGPVILSIQAISISGSSQTIITIQLSAEIPASEALNLSNWSVESPAGTPLNLTGSQITYDSTTKIVKIILPTTIPNTNTLLVRGITLHDSLGNLTSSTARSATSILKNAALDSSSSYGGKKPTGKSVTATAQIAAKFDRLMDATTLKAGMSLRMITNNIGTSVNTLINGNIVISTDGTEAQLIPSNPLAKGSQFKVTLASTILDSNGFAIGSEISWSFRTVIDNTIASTLSPIKGLKITVNPGVFGVDATVVANADPLNNALMTSHALIKGAMDFEKQKGAEIGKPDHYPIQSMMVEIYGQAIDDSIIQGKLGGTIDLTLDYPDADGDGIVDGTNPPVAAKDLQFYYLDEALKEFKLIKGSIVDPTNKTVTVSVDHFTIFSVMKAPVTDVSSVLIRPTVWRVYQDPAPVVIDFLPDQSSVDVYSVTGQKVRSLFLSDGSGSLKWDGTNENGDKVASGVYYLLIRGNGGTRKEKMVVIK